MAELNVKCPKCGGNFSWNTLKKIGFCFKCSHVIRSQSQFDTQVGVEAPKEYRGLQIAEYRDKSSWVPAMQSQRAMEYLKHRGVWRSSTIEDIDVRYSPQTDEICFPICSPHPHMPREWVRRNITGKGWFTDRIDKEHYWFCPPDYIPSEHDRFVLVEGVFDLLSPNLWGCGAALLGSNLSNSLLKFLIFNAPKELVIWFDADETGINKAVEIESRLGGLMPKTKIQTVHGWRHEEDLQRDPGTYEPTEGVYLIEAALNTGQAFPIKTDRVLEDTFFV